MDVPNLGKPNEEIELKHQAEARQSQSVSEQLRGFRLIMPAGQPPRCENRAPLASSTSARWEMKFRHVTSTSLYWVTYYSTRPKVRGTSYLPMLLLNVLLQGGWDSPLLADFSHVCMPMGHQIIITGLQAKPCPSIFYLVSSAGDLSPPLLPCIMDNLPV